MDFAFALALASADPEGAEAVRFGVADLDGGVVQDCLAALDQPALRDQSEDHGASDCRLLDGLYVPHEDCQFLLRRQSLHC